MVYLFLFYKNFQKLEFFICEVMRTPQIPYGVHTMTCLEGTLRSDYLFS